MGGLDPYALVEGSIGRLTILRYVLPAANSVRRRHSHQWSCHGGQSRRYKLAVHQLHVPTDATLGNRVEALPESAFLFTQYVRGEACIAGCQRLRLLVQADC